MTMEQILKESILEIERKGIRSLTIGKVSKKCGLSRVTFYKYFSSKEQLLQAAVSKIFDGWIAEVDRILSSRKSLEEKLKLVLDFKELQIRTTSLSLYNDLRSPPDSIVMLSQDFQRRAFQRFDQLITECRRAGVIDKRISNETVFIFARHLQLLGHDEAFRKSAGSPHDTRSIIFRLFYKGIH